MTYFLLDMKEAAEKILKYTKGLSFEDFLADDKTIDAVVRNFEIIGEASLRIDEDFRFEHPQIEWKKLRGLVNCRNTQNYEKVKSICTS